MFKDRLYFDRISNPLVYRSYACGVLFLSFMNAGQRWEESFFQGETKR
jgi:hypothetical protein